jgi:hypothetical protein
MYDILLKSTTKKLTYNFFSAWSPPIPVIEKMGKMFKKLSFDLEFLSEGEEFEGTLLIENGKVVSNSYKERNQK